MRISLIVVEFVVVLSAVQLQLNAMQTQTAADTLDYTLPEVVVSATRTRISPLDSPSPLITVTRADIDRMGGIRLSDALTRVPGMLQRDLGGPGGLKTLVMRGTQATHTVVLFDGVRLNSFQNGLVDAGLIGTIGLERMEIVRGGQSALYGADAIGGVVNLLPVVPGDSLGLTLGGSVGSFDTWSANTAVSGTIGGLSLAGGFGREKSLGDFTYRQNENGTTVSRIRENAQSDISTGFLHLRHPLFAGTTLSLNADYVSAARGVPGPVVGGTSSSARLDDEAVRTYLNFKNHSPSLGSTIISLSYQNSLERYADTLGIIRVDDTYKNVARGVSLQWSRALGSDLLAFVTGELVDASLQGDPLGGTVRRSQQSVSGGIEFVWKNEDFWIKKISLYPLLRYDSFSDVTGMWSPRFGLNVWLHRSGTVQLRASVGRSFRAPNFNELYWRPGGNPDLGHEQAWQADAGARIALDGMGTHVVDATYFYVAMRNRITGWPPVNLAQSANQGIELQWQWGLPWSGIYLDVNATLTDAHNLTDQDYGKQIPFVPRMLVRGSFRVDVGEWMGELRGQYISRQYTTPDNAPALSVAPSTVLDAMIEYRFHHLGVPLAIHVSLFNVLNEEYEVVKGYPMPLRNFRAGMRFSL